MMLMKLILMLPELWGHSATRPCWDLGDMGLGVVESSSKGKIFTCKWQNRKTTSAWKVINFQDLQYLNNKKIIKMPKYRYFTREAPQSPGFCLSSRAQTLKLGSKHGTVIHAVCASMELNSYDIYDQHQFPWVPWVLQQGHAPSVISKPRINHFLSILHPTGIRKLTP